MRYVFFFLLGMLVVAFVVTIGLFFAHHHTLVKIESLGCVDIPASPDYLSSGSASDAIAAINNARQTEHLHSLRIPTNFYHLNPAQQQFILLNLERTDRGLHPLQMDANLTYIAGAYSKQLLDLHFFSHTSPIAGTFSDRVNNNLAIANHYSLAAENLAGNPVAGIGPMYEYMYDDSAENCAHRNNILDPTLALYGINWVHGSAYGSISAQEFLTSSPSNPYVGATPDASVPQITLSVNSVAESRSLQCLALAYDKTGIERITWFLDSVARPLQVGPVFTLDMRHLSAGRHTLFVYAVDGDQNYAMTKYVFVV